MSEEEFEEDCDTCDFDGMPIMDQQSPCCDCTDSSKNIMNYKKKV